MDTAFALAYQINTVVWDGRLINRLPEEEIGRSLDLMAACGISRVMVSGYHLEEESSFDMDAETRRIGAELAARSMSASQHHSLAPMYAPFDAPQDEVVERLCRCVDFSANLGAAAMVIHPGRALGRFAAVGDFIAVWRSECARRGRERVLETCAANLRAAGAHAAARGVLIAVENVDRFEPFGGIEDLPRLVEAAGSPAVGCCLDSGHAHCAGIDPVRWIETMGDRLFTTHFHDNRGPAGPPRTPDGFITPEGIDEHMPPGFGTISWIDVIAALRRIGYARPVTFESGGWPGMEPREGIAAAVAYWRTCERLALTRPPRRPAA